MASKKNSVLIDEESVSTISGLLHQYNDRLLADDSLSDLDVLLLSIYLIDQKHTKSGATYNEVKDLFIYLGRKERPNFGVAIHNAKKQNFVEEKNKVLYFSIKGLKRIRNVLGQVGKSPVYIIKSGENFTAIKLFEEFLVSEIKDNEILLCDPYISPSTLYPFSVLKNKVKNIKILTSNIYESEKFKEYKKKLEKETNISIEVKNSKKIHDRYLICGKKCWSIGSSIKDLGNKDAMIKELDGVLNSLKDLFLERFNENT
ncbi:MAG: hypothetical protein H3Z50_05560 [archaeon]|nr:hypothetical protein [archaeon]MCP8305947.1 hypothetical protein [archaeon]